MGNGGHVISALNLEKQLCSNPGLYIYDGLSEYRRKGQGLHLLVSIGTLLTGYKISYAVYIRKL